MIKFRPHVKICDSKFLNNMQEHGNNWDQLAAPSPQITQSTVASWMKQKSPVHTMERDPAHGRLLKTKLSTPSQNLAVDMPGLVTKLVELNMPSRHTEVSGPPAHKGALALRTGQLFSAWHRAQSCRSHLVHSVESVMHIWLEALSMNIVHFFLNPTAPSESSVLALVCLCWFGIVRGLFTETMKGYE